METAAKIYEEGKKANKDVVQVNPAWVLEESLESLSSKFPILPRSQGSLTFCTTPLSSKLESKPEDALFDLTDQNLLRYNVLHDRHLKEYFQNPEIRRRLFDQGFITEDGYVKCNLVEFNNFRKWIRKLKLEEFYKQRRLVREEEISHRNHQLMLKKLEREKESLYIVREREKKVKEYAKKRREKRDRERVKYFRLHEIEIRRREKMRKERRNQLDDVEEERERRQVARGFQKIMQEDKKRKIKLRIVRKRKQEDSRRDAAIKERKLLGRCQRNQERKNQWKRRCTIALGNITENWKEEKRILDVRQRNIERRAKMFQKRQEQNQESMTNFVSTRRATLHHEFLEAEEFLNKLRMRKDIEISNWKRKHERMLSRGSSISSVQARGSKVDDLDEYMALGRWSAPDRTGFRRRLKSTWDLKSSLIKDLEEESPSPVREEADGSTVKEPMKEPRKDISVKVRSFIKNIINNAHNVFEEEKKRFAVKGLVGGIIGSAVAVVEKEKTHKRTRTCVRRYVFSVIEAASQTLEKERRDALKAKMEEEARKRVKEQMNRIAAELVSAAMVFAKRRVEKEVKEKAAEDEEELKYTAKWIVGTAIERACIRFRGQAQDIRRVSSESLPEALVVEAEEVDYDLRLDWAVRNVVSDAVATAVDSMERLYYKESDLMEAATGLMNCAIINAQESLENMYRVTPALEEQINRMAWRLANRALISAENTLEKQREESIKHAAEELTSHAILSAQNSFARMEEQMLCETAEELALKAIMTAQKSLRKTEEEEFFSQELATRAILEAKESLVRAEEIELTSRELARQAIELAQVTSQTFPRERADEAKKIAVAAAERCIEAYKSQENLPPESDLIATEALKLAIQAINSCEGLLEDVQPRTTCVLTDGKLLAGVMQYVEGIIVRALQELESNKDIDVLKPGNIRPDDYRVLSHSDTNLHRKSFIKDDISLSRAGETSKAASSSRRRSSVHFNATNIMSNRKDSTSSDSDHLKVRERPPTPRFLAQRSFTNQLACSILDTLEEKLKGIEKKDKVKVLLSTRKGSPTFADRRLLHLRRFSSDQNIAVKRRPVIAFQVPHAASDSYFRRPSDNQDSELVKEMLDSSQESEADVLDVDKEHRECEYDTLVSMTNTPEPQAVKDSEVDILQNIKSSEERIPCQITPRTSSYILLPKLESNEKVLLQAKVTELEQMQRGVELSLTHLPAVSPTTSLVMVQDADVSVRPESETTLPTEELTNLPKISKSGSLVSMDRELAAKDSVQERARTVSEAKSEAQLKSAKSSQAEVPLVATKPSSQVTPVPSSDEVMEVSSRSSIEKKMSPRSSSRLMKMAPIDTGKVSPKPSREAAEVLPSSDSTSVVKVSSTEAVPAPSREKLSPKPSKKRITPATSTETAQVAPKLSSKITIVSPKASSEYMETEKTTTEGPTSPKLSSDVIKESVESSHSMKEAPGSATEAAKLSPKPSGESAKLSPKVSSESQEMTHIPSTESVKVSPKPSIEKADMAEKDITEAKITAPIASTEECKVPKEPSKELLVEPSKKSITVTPSTDAAEVSSKPSREAAGVSPKASTKSAKVTSVLSTDAAEVPSKPSREAAGVSPKASTKSAKVTSVLSTDAAEVPFKPSREAAGVSPKASTKSAKVTPVPSTVAVELPSKSSSEFVKDLPKDSSESTKMVAVASSSEKMQVSLKSSSEAARVSPKPSSESAEITPMPSTVAAEPSKPTIEDVKVLSKDSSEAAKLPLTTSESEKMRPSLSGEEAKVSPKASFEKAELFPKASIDAKKMTPAPSAEAAKVYSKLSIEETEVLQKDVSESKMVASTITTEAHEISPRLSKVVKLSPEASKKSLTSAPTSTEAARVSPKSSSEVARVSPKASSKSVKITPISSSVAAELSPKPSGNDVNVLPKGSTVSTKIAAVPSSEKTHVTPKPSREAAGGSPSEIAKLPPQSSRESTKIKPTTSIEKTHVSPKTSIEDTKTTKITPAPSTEAARLSPKSSASEGVKPSPKGSKIISTASTEAVAAKLSSDSVSKKMKQVSTDKVSSEASSEQDKLLSKTSSESSKMTPMSSVEDAKVTSKPSEVKKLLPKSSSRSTRVIPRKSHEAAKLTSRSSAEVAPKPSIEAAKLPKRSSSESTKMTSKPSTESVKMPKKSPSVKTEPSSSDSTKMTPKPSTEVKVPPKASVEATDLSPKASSLSKRMSQDASKDVTKVSPKPSLEASTDLSPKASGLSTKMSQEASKDVIKVSPKPSVEASTDLSPKASGLSTKMSPKASKDVVKVSPKASSDVARVSSQTSQMSTKTTRMESKETVKVSSKPSTDSTKLASSTSSKMVPSPPSDKGKVSRKPSREASKLSTKTSTASTKVTSDVSSESPKVSPKPSGEAAILTPKTSSVSSKMSPKPSEETTKLSPKRSTDSTKVASRTLSTKMEPTSSTDTAQVSAKQSTKSVKLSKKTSSETTKVASTPSTEVAAKLATPKPSQVSGESSKKKLAEREMAEATAKSSTKITPSTAEDSHDHQELTSKASKGDSKLSLKRSRESSILSPKVSRDSHKKKAKHHRTVSKKTSGETVKLAAKTSSQSTKMSSEVSPKDSQVISQMSSMAIKDSSEGSDISPETSHLTTKDVTKDKMSAGSSGEIVKVPSTKSEAAKTTDSAETISRKPSRKTSKTKPSSESLRKVSSKTEDQEPKPSVSANVVSTYVIETPVPSTNVDLVAMDGASGSSKSLNKLQTQGSSSVEYEGLQEKVPEISNSRTRDSQSPLPHKDGPHELGGNRRISLSVPDPVVALKGVGRKTSLPGGAFSEHEFERRSLSSTLHDISESKEFHEASTSDDTNGQNQDQSLEDTLGVADAEDRRLSLVHSIPSITVQEPSSPPNDDNVLLEEDERVRIIYELEHAHPVCSDEQISIDNRASGTEPMNHGSGERRTSNSEFGTTNSPKQSKPSIPDIHNEKVSDIVKVHRPSIDDESSSQLGSESPKRQSVTCIGIQFSPTGSKEHVLPNRASEVSSKTRVAKGSISKIRQRGSSVREPLSDSFELKGTGLGGGRSSSRALISSRSTEFPRTKPLQTSRGHFSSHSLDTPLSRGVIVTPLKPSPPLSPRLIESSARRSRLKMALSQQRAKETQSETSLTSSKSEPGETSPKKGSATLLGSGSGSSVNSSLTSKESGKSLPERPSTASGMLKREKIKASRAIISSSSSERSSDRNVNQQA